MYIFFHKTPYWTKYPPQKNPKYCPNAGRQTKHSLLHFDQYAYSIPIITTIQNTNTPSTSKNRHIPSQKFRNIPAGP